MYALPAISKKLLPVCGGAGERTTEMNISTCEYLGRTDNYFKILEAGENFTRSLHMAYVSSAMRKMRLLYTVVLHLEDASLSHGFACSSEK